MDNDIIYTGRDMRIRNPMLDHKDHPCRDCGRVYTLAESVTVRVQTRPDPVWEGCIDCWVRRTNPEMCQTFVED